MNSTNNPFYTVEITSLVNGGNGLGTLPDGRKVFIPFSIPGEVLRINTYNEKKNYCFGKIQEIITPSPARIQPRCKHFGICGGCNFQQLSYADQIKVKLDVLNDQMRHLTRQVSFPIRPIVPSPYAWEYRNHVQFHPTNEGKMAYLASSSNQQVEIEECFLMEKPLDQLWGNLVLEPDSQVDRVSWRVNDQQDVMLLLEGYEKNPPEFAVDFPLNGVYIGEDGPVTLSGDPFLLYGVNQKIFQVSAESFFQVNTGMIGLMVDHILENIQPHKVDTMMDIYCGVGLFTKFLAPYVNRCVGIEVSTSAVEDFVTNLDEFDNVDVYLGAAEEIVPWLDIQAEVILVDPPRSGLAKKALDAILKIQPEALVYLSCDTASFARDSLNIISAGYELGSLSPFDLFPQTYHLETMGIFHKQK